MADRAITAALSPADVRQQLDALRGQPRALLAGREVDVRFGPAARPMILGPVEAGRAEPVLQRQLVRVANSHPPLLGTVDEEQPAERPERLAAERALRLLVEQDDAPASRSQLGCRDEARESRADDDHVGVCRRRAHRAIISESPPARRVRWLTVASLPHRAKPLPSRSTRPTPRAATRRSIRTGATRGRDRPASRSLRSVCARAPAGRATASSHWASPRPSCSAWAPPGLLNYEASCGSDTPLVLTGDSGRQP